MSFGKKPSTNTPPPASVAVDGGQSTIVDAPPDGANADMLRQLSLDADSASHPNAASLNARIEEGKSALEARAAEAQAQARQRYPAAELRPFFLIPDPCWQDEQGLFLMSALDLYPYDDWNIVFLAADEATAKALDIALHPNGNVPAFLVAAEKFMPGARHHMQQATQEAELTHDFAAFADARADAQLRVKSLAMSFARALIEAWDEHQGVPAL